jgi:hypothetical protein
MKTTTLQLLPTTSHGTPSGNYDGSSLDFDGVQQQAANYYGGFGSLQTIAFFLSGFQGRVRIQASLDSSPTTDAQWFQISDVDSTTTSTTANFSRNINGNFVWIRARVTNFEAGNIEKIMMSY